jgi:hypothetical protein
MIETTAFATFVTDNEWYEKCAIPLQKTAHFFHTNIPFYIFTLDNLKEKYPYINIGNAKAIIGKELYDKYNLVIILDADSLITSTLDELLIDDYDIAGVRNISDHGSVHMETNLELFQVKDICNKTQYLNAGLVASRKKSFFDDWDNTKEVKRFDLDQGTLNIIAYTKNYKLKVLDPIKSLLYYGVSNSWGDKTPWDSWKTIKLINGKLMLRNKQNILKQVKILHKAGSGKNTLPGNKFSRDLFSPEVFNFLQEIQR